MSEGCSQTRVLYSFPHKLGAGRICYTAWQQVNGLAAAGAEVVVFPGVQQRDVPAGVKISPTLACGSFRIPYQLIGSRRALALHDRIVAKRVEKLAGKIDIIHTWPQGALRTLETAARLGIPTVLERPNAHTRFAYEVVRDECTRLGMILPPDHEHAYNERVLKIEEEEFSRAYRLLCPSDFVVKTFKDRSFPETKLVRHIYGFDERTFFPAPVPPDPERGLNVLFVGVCAVRKGLHFALEAWLRCRAHRRGTFRIAGEFLPAYAKAIAPALSQTSVQVLGHRMDIPELMRMSDVLILPSIEEGFGLVCTEAMGSGCVPLVSDACTELCRHMENSLVHRVGDVAALSDHLSLLDRRRDLLQQLRSAGLRLAPRITWSAAGVKLLDVYREAIADYARTTRTTADIAP
jgi:glycosyltransferase involved in cell wall biosynthesis